MAETIRILMVIAPRTFRDEEFLEPKKIFDDHGFKVVVASERKGECFGKLGLRVWATESVNHINPHDYDAIVFVGGTGAMEFFDHDEVKLLVQEANVENKILAAICIAPTILANAGVLEGKHATCFETQEAHLRTKGAILTGKEVEVDANIVTARDFEAAEQFGVAIANLLGD